MAGQTSGKLLEIAVIGAFVYGGYRIALNGAFGPAIQGAAAQVNAAISGHPGVTITPVPIGGTVVPIPSTGGSAFIPGVRYVAPAAGGGFEVVIGGARVAVYATQTEAENAYNRMVP